MTIHHSACRKVRRSAVSAMALCAALGALTLPIGAHAQFSGKASATGQFESNSNVYDLSSGQAPPGSDGRRSDTFFAYGGDFELRYAWGRQDIYATADTHKYSYQHFSSLDHNDYKVDTGL